MIAMGTSSDRARLRTDLRELAKLAGSDSTPAPHAFESADSSGFVDLSGFSAADDSGTSLDTWVERELARAGGRAKGGAVLTPGSMAPVAMSSLLGEAEPVDRGARKRGWVYTGLGLAGAAVVGVLAVALARHAPPSAKNAPQTEVAAAAPQPAAPPAATPREAPAASAPVATTSAAPIAVTVSAPDPAPASKKHPARWHASPAATAAPAAVAAARPAPAKVTIPAAKSGGGGGDSLMDMMRASINTPKKVH